MEFLKSFGSSVTIMFAIAFVVALAVIIDKIWKKFVTTKNIANVEPNESFDIVYQELLNYFAKKLARLRRWEIVVYITVILILAIMLALGSFLVTDRIIGDVIWSRIAIILFVTIIVFIIKNNKFRKKYKKEIVERLVKKINPSLEYRAIDEFFLEYDYEKIGFNDKKFIDVNVDDYMIGRLGETAIFSIADLSVIEEDGGLIPGFRGVVACMNYNNDIRNNIIIEEDRIVDTGTELPENFLNRLIEIYKKYGIVPEIRIKRSYAFLRIHTGEFFEPGMDPMDKQKLFNYYNVIRFINEVMTEIKNATEI